MEQMPLVFPCQISEQEYSIINVTRLELAEKIIPLQAIVNYSPRSVVADLMQVCYDLRELMSYQKSGQNKFNSYILRLAILKLDYVVSVLNHNLTNDRSRICNLLLTYQSDLQAILLRSYQEFKASVS